MMLCGTPYLNINSLIKLIAVQASRILIGLASIHLVNLSTATSTWVKPLLPTLSGPTISNPQTAKGQTNCLRRRLHRCGESREDCVVHRPSEPLPLDNRK